MDMKNEEVRMNENYSYIAIYSNCCLERRSVTESNGNRPMIRVLGEVTSNSKLLFLSGVSFVYIFFANLIRPATTPLDAT